MVYFFSLLAFLSKSTEYTTGSLTYIKYYIIARHAAAQSVASNIYRISYIPFHYCFYPNSNFHQSHKLNVATTIPIILSPPQINLNLTHKKRQMFLYERRFFCINDILQHICHTFAYLFLIKQLLPETSHCLYHILWSPFVFAQFPLHS